MIRRGTHTSSARRRAAITAAAVLALGACSAEDLAEKAAEEAIEQQLEQEGGGDVDLNLDDGEIRVEGSNGEEVVVNVNEDGDGNVSIQGSGSEGDVEMEFGEDGQSVISTPEGEFVTGTNSLPDGFPENVPVPDGMTIESTGAMDSPDGPTFVVNGAVAGDFAGATAAYKAALEGAGFTQQSMTESADGTFFAFVSGDWNVSGGFYPNSAGDGSAFGISVVPAAP